MSNKKFYRKSLTLLLPILEMINEGFIPTDIASRLDISNQLVSYYIKKGIESGYVRELWRDTFKAYELTQPGKNFLAMSHHQHSSSSMSKPICRAENIRLKAHVYRMPSSPVDWHKVEMHNWTQYTTEVDCIKIKLNDGDTPTIEFIPAPIDGDDPYVIYGKLLLGCNDVAKNLEQTLDMKIGLERSSRGEWVVYNPLAKVITNKIGQVSLEGIGKINASLPNRYGEFEFYDPRAAAGFLEMPRRVAKLEHDIGHLLQDWRFKQPN
jgi:predicted transcriptional regulator